MAHMVYTTARVLSIVKETIIKKKNKQTKPSKKGKERKGKARQVFFCCVETIEREKKEESHKLTCRQTESKDRLFSKRSMIVLVVHNVHNKTHVLTAPVAAKTGKKK